MFSKREYTAKPRIHTLAQLVNKKPPRSSLLERFTFTNESVIKDEFNETTSNNSEDAPSHEASINVFPTIIDSKYNSPQL